MKKTTIGVVRGPRTRRYRPATAWAYPALWSMLACGASRAAAPRPTEAPAHEHRTEAAVTGAAVSGSPLSFASEAEILSVLERRITGPRGDAAPPPPSYGIVVGVIDAGGRRVVGYGAMSAGDPRPVAGQTLFEIGSITKVFTALLLAEAVLRHEVRLDDPVQRYLPASAHVPTRPGQVVTLQALATHTSGLPMHVPNFERADPDNPYADYTVEKLYEYLNTAELEHDVGTTYEYSNIGMGLLGHVLALHAGMSYEELVRARVTEPLGMHDTRIQLPPELAARLAPGHKSNLAPATNWDLPALAGAGALRSSADDLLKFVAAAAGLTETPLAPAFATLLTVRRPMGGAGQGEVALGWQVTELHDHRVVSHGGATGGYRSFIGFDPATRRGVVALTNVKTDAGNDDLALHLLDPSVPLTSAPAPRARTAVPVATEVLTGHVGRYEVAPGRAFNVTLEGGQLYARLGRQGANAIFPSGPNEFFYVGVDAEISFERDAEGHTTALTLHQGGVDYRAPRVEPPNKVHVPPHVLDRYVGHYQLAPDVVLAITRQEGVLYAQLTGQRMSPIFSVSERDFFLESAGATLSFELGPGGNAAAVVIHQDGTDQRAVRSD
jgi:D-alanyl-D-alanine-carboxypeptidase/D-alanyl-D-alanine-endopeptidase